MPRLVFSQPNPQSLKIVHEDKCFDEINRYVEECEHNTSQWSSKQQKYHRIRMAIKKVKTFPFKNSSNLRMPTAEINIKKLKSAIMGQVFGIRPVVQALPSPSGSQDVALKIEKLLDHLIMDVMKLEVKAEIGVDQALEKGFYLGKPYWRLDIIDREEEINLNELTADEVVFLYSAEREQVIEAIVKRFEVDTHEKIADENITAIDDALNKIYKGKAKVTLYLRDIVYNFPDADFISPERVYVPTDSGFDIQKIPTKTIEFFLPLDTIKQNARDKGWDMGIVNDLEAYRDTTIDKMTDIDKDLKEGISRMQNPSGLVRVWETYGWHDIGNGKKQKAVITSLPDFKATVRKVLIDTATGKDPLVKFYYEMTSDRWFSHRGIPEVSEDLIKEIDVQHNMKIDGQTLRNAPMIVYRAGMVNPSLAKVNPAAAIPVNGLNPLDDTIRAINLHNPNAEFSYEREQMILETKMQELTGQVDFGVQSLINKRQPRTLGEVQQQVGSAARTASLDIKHFMYSFSELFEMIFELWLQHGDEEYQFLYFGENPNQGELIKLSREEIQGKYKIVVRGNDQNTNPEIKKQKAQLMFQMISNPLLLQSGIVGPQQIANGIKRFAQYMEIDNWEELINVQPQVQPKDPKQDMEIGTEDLTDSEIAQILQAKGIQPDVAVRDQKRKVQLLKEAAEIANKAGD